MFDMNWIENPHPLRRKLPEGVDFYDIIVAKNDSGRVMEPGHAGIAFVGPMIVTHYYFYYTQQVH